MDIKVLLNSNITEQRHKQTQQKKFLAASVKNKHKKDENNRAGD